MGLLDGALGDALGSAMGGKGSAGNLQGMLGGLLGQLGGGQGTSNALLTTAMSLLQQQGGLEGIVKKFSAGGMGSMVESWVGTGANAPVSAAQITQVFGESTVTDIAKQLGTDPQQASGSLASVLPELINRLTPDGQIPSNSADVLTQGIALLRTRLGA